MSKDFFYKLAKAFADAAPAFGGPFIPKEGEKTPAPEKDAISKQIDEGFAKFKERVQKEPSPYDF